MRHDQESDLRGAAGTVADGWIDLSQGINRRPWTGASLPTDASSASVSLGHLIRVAAEWFGCQPAQVLPWAGGPAIEAIARLLPAGRAATLAPGADGHAATLRAAGWQAENMPDIAAMEGADLAVVANPNDPDGREWQPGVLAHHAARVGHLVVDESLTDARPDLSLAPMLPPNTLVLRGLDRFWGLSRLRLGFVLAPPLLLDRLSGAAGPVDTAAMEIAAGALADRAWADDAILYQSEAALRLDRIACRAGWRPAGGTHLFRLYDTGDAQAAQDRLARARIRARTFPWSDRWLRLAIPADHTEWDRLTAALREI